MKDEKLSRKTTTTTEIKKTQAVNIYFEILCENINWNQCYMYIQRRT